MRAVSRSRASDIPPQVDALVPVPVFQHPVGDAGIDEHRDAAVFENACPMVALPSDVARGGVNARKAYQTAFEAMVEILQQGSQNDVLPSRKSALAIAALCIGGMVIARASDDPALGDELREAAMTIALQLGGWNADPAPAGEQAEHHHGH